MKDTNSVLIDLPRYEIEGDDVAWKEAETQALKATKSGKLNPVVSVKSKTKRKAEADGVDEAEKAHSKAKKVKKDKRR